ncbi:hypothetical protein L6164_035541 [Bauhinia variegata]|uniref:Uncharacterized protein n=1 Tax=Bauhinia variegata TaxID=167791 RepID=A0ACB9KEA2_BAUVA|nr:hypothetical protein L6164_035541 [Bauhinia variegata]
MITKEVLRTNKGMATARVLRMNGGVGETSYANNSLLHEDYTQDETSTRRKHQEALECLKVADLGCSSGPNELVLISEIINTVDATSRSLNREPQFFLNDLFGNDFNTIFMYGRLFPSNSLHFFHSSYSLHWLSQVPEGLTKGEEPLEKDNIYVTRTEPPAVYKAYLEQFQQDELVSGGRMVLTLLGRDDWALIGMALRDMVKEVTLSGLLNFIDGLWSSCGDESIIAFTTNHRDRLDTALPRPGRMDVHIHMSYCTPCGF